MFQRFVAIMLCSCMLVGNTAETAYATSTAENNMVVYEDADMSEEETEEEEGLEEAGGETSEESETKEETRDSVEETVPETEETYASTEETVVEREDDLETGEETVPESEEAVGTLEATVPENVEETGTDEAELSTETEEATESVKQETAADTTPEVVLEIGEVTYKSAELKCEAFCDGMRGYYAPVNAPEKKQSFYLYDGRNSYTLEELEPATEYRVWIADSDGAACVEKSFITQELSLKAEYEIKPLGNLSFYIDVNVSEYDGNCEKLYFCVQCTDESERVQVRTSEIELTGEKGKKTGSSNCFPAYDLLADTTYPIDMWIQEEEYTEVHYAKETKTVTTKPGILSEEDVTFRVAQNETVKTSLDYAIEINNLQDFEYAVISYRLKGESIWQNVAEIKIEDETYTGTLTDLQAGMEYEIKLYIREQGIRKVVSCQMGTAQFAPKLSDNTDIFDTVLNYQLKSDNSLKGEEWNVAIYYKEEQAQNYKFIDKKELTAKNKYKQQLKTADYLFLKPDTKYSFMWQLYKIKGGKSVMCHTAYQTIQTKASDVIANADMIAMNSAEYTISTAARSENMKNNPLVLYPYISENGGEYKVIDNKFIYLFGEYYGNSYKISFRNLKENTDYNISLRDERGETEYACFSFTTLADDLKVEVDDIAYHAESAVFQVNAVGTAIDGTDYLYLYYREKGCEKWESNIARLDTTGVYSIHVDEYAGKALKECTVYEYELGVGETYSTARKDLTHKKTGEFKTIRDDRIFVLERVVPHLDSVEFYMNISGAAAEDFDNNVVFYYREKGTTEWKSGWKTQTGSGDLVAEIPGFSGNLKKETTYEYVVGLSRKYNLEMKSLKQIVKGEFTTCADDRNLAVYVNPGLYSAKVLVNLTGKVADTEATCILLYYKEKGSEKEWESVNSTRYSGKGTMVLDITSFAGAILKEETVYEYVVGIGNNTSTPKSDLTKVVNGEFTTGKDSRTIQLSGCQPGYGTAVAEVAVEGNRAKEQIYVYSYYREKGTEEWKSGACDSEAKESFQMQLIFGTEDETLKQDTEYEYFVVLSKKGNTTVPDENMLKERQYVKGSFKTKKNGYKPEAVTNGAKTTYKTAELTVTAKGSQEDEKIYVTLYFSNGEEKKITLYQKNNYKSKVLLTGLKPDTEYSLCRAELFVKEHGCELLLGSFTQNVSFHTKKATVPKSIVLSHEKISLNGEDNTYETYCQQLRATIAPKNAAGDIVWSSNNIFVADVTQDGKVYANGEGTAVITAKSLYDETVQASCEVTVKNYVVGKSENLSVSKVTEVQSVYKGEAVSDLGLYEEKKDGSLVPVEDYRVTSERSGVVCWENGKLIGKAVGTTIVFFEKDGCKASVKVNVLTKAKKGFGVTGLEASDIAYPAIVKADGSYEIAYAEGLSYNVQGKISFTEDFESSDFDWTSSDETVATIINGKIEPKRPGKATITVTPKESPSPFVQDSVELKLIVKEIPVIKEKDIYVLTNLKKKMRLSDVDLTETLGEGWEWKHPKTSLYSLPRNSEAYLFEAVYTGKDRYPCESVVHVYIGTIKKVNTVEKYDNHNQVIQVYDGEAKQKDEIRLQILPEYTGTLAKEVITELPSVKGLNIEWEEATNSWLITASKKGNYVLKPKVSIVTKNSKGQDVLKTIMSGTYKLKAVEGVQADTIRLSSDTEGVAIDEKTGSIILDLSEETKNKQIKLTATVKDRNGNELKTAVEWKSSDKKVASVKGNKKDSHQATLTLKGNDGHTIVTVKAKDATGYTARLNLEIRDHRPRVNKTKAKINLAYEYENFSGRNLAAASDGTIEIAEVYGEQIESVALYKEDKKTPEKDIAVWYYNSDGTENYLLKPAVENLAAGIYKCQLAVKTEASDELYFYPLQINVKNEAPKVKAKMSEKVNLFYRTKAGSAFLTVAGESEGVEAVTWEDNSAETGNGFEVYYSWTPSEEKEKKYLVYVYSDQVKVKKAKPEDSKITKGTLRVKLAGVREPVEIKNFKIAYCYKKPALKTVTGTTNVFPKTGSNSNSFRIYDNVTKEYLTFYEGEGYTDYNEISCVNDAVDISADYSVINYTYRGNKKQEKITLTLHSAGWRESLSVKHTIQAIEPKAYLSDELLEYNTAYENEIYTSINVKNCSDIVELTDVVITGSNAKSQALLDNDIVQIVQGESKTSELMVRMDSLLLAQKKVAAGTYTFQLKPYYRNAVTGEKTTLNTVKLKVKVVAKPVTVKIHTKGTQD